MAKNKKNTTNETKLEALRDAIHAAGGLPTRDQAEAVLAEVFHETITRDVSLPATHHGKDGTTQHGRWYQVAVDIAADRALIGRCLLACNGYVDSESGRLAEVGHAI